MHSFFKCFWYLVITGIVAFFVGRVLPKKWFRADLFPYRTLKFEDEGHFYDKFSVRKWQNKVPDMSKILPFMMPPKKLTGNYKERLPRMLQETCVAELIHMLNCVAGLYCLKLYPGIGGVIIYLIYVFLLNLPFVVIQRYNRPRLMKLLRRIEIEEAKERSERAACECSY